MTDDEFKTIQRRVEDSLARCADTNYPPDDELEDLYALIKRVEAQRQCRDALKAVMHDLRVRARLNGNIDEDGATVYPLSHSVYLKAMQALHGEEEGKDEG